MTDFRRRAVVIVSVVLLAAVGCGDGDELGDAAEERTEAVDTSPTPTPAHSPTPTPSPSTTATEEPEPEPETEAEPEPEKEPAEETKLLEVAVMDYTEQNPPGDRLEIWVRGHGSWYPDVEFGGDGPQAMGEFPVADLQTDDFYIYPDGQDGTEILVEFQMTEDMISGSDRDRTHVEIYDGRVEVWGGPDISGDGQYDR